jgi:hypothetical protein
LLLRTLFAVEWATGTRDFVVDSVIFFLTAPDSQGWVYGDSNNSAYFCDDAFCTNRVKLDPPGVDVFSGAASAANFRFSPDSKSVIFADLTGTNYSGVWVVPVTNPEAFVRVSDPSHSAILSIHVSNDGSRVFYTNGTAFSSGVQLFGVSITGGAVTDFTVPGFVSVDIQGISIDRASLFVAFRMSTLLSTKKRLFVAPINGSAVDAIEVSPDPSAASSFGAVGGLDWSDNSLVLFQGQYAQFGTKKRWFASNPLFPSSHPISLRSTVDVSNSYAIFGGSDAFAYVGRAPNGTVRAALWLVNATNDVDITGATQLSINGPGSVTRVFDRFGSVLGYTGDLITRTVEDLFFVPLNGPANLSVKVNPPGAVDSIIPTGRKVAFRTGFRTFYVADLSTSTISVAVSRPQDVVSLLFPAANAISAVYFTANPNELFVTCLISPTLVLPNQTLVLNSTSLDGHLILGSNTSVLEVTVTTVVAVGGTVVLNGGVLVVDSCANGTFEIIHATNVVGIFGTISSTSCNCQLSSSSTAYSSSTITITLVVDSNAPTCQPGGIVTGTTSIAGGAASISRNAIIGIAIGTVCFAVLAVIALILILKWRQRVDATSYNSEIHIGEVANLKASAAIRSDQ